MTEGERLIWAAGFVQGGENIASERVRQFRVALQRALEVSSYQRSPEENVLIDFVSRPSAAESLLYGVDVPAGVFADEVSALRKDVR